MDSKTKANRPLLVNRVESENGILLLDKGTQIERVLFLHHDKKLLVYARQNRKNPTAAEKLMWEILSRRQFYGFKFIRQKPMLHFIADFYCSKLLLVIEIDGDTHDEQYDIKRSSLLKNKYNIDVIRYSNDDMLNNAEGVYINLQMKIKEKAKKYLESYPPPVKGEIEGVLNTQETR